MLNVTSAHPTHRTVVRAHLNTYIRREEPMYKGYTSHREAREAYDLHLRQQAAIRALPPLRMPTTCVPPSPRTLSATPNRPLSSPLNRQGSPAKSSSSPASGSGGTRANRTQVAHHDVLQGARNMSLAPPVSPTVVPAQDQALFFVVLHGYNPGVYNSLSVI